MPDTPSTPTKPLEPISIWAPVVDSGGVRFERPAPGIFADHYAPRRSLALRAQPDQRRIVFLGESAAAGYLYAPYLTPALRLQELLSATPVLGPVDVIDLARTNETLSGLVTTARSSRQLRPDLFVVFTGNNWGLLETQDFSAYGPPAGRQAVGESLAAGGWSQLARNGAQHTLRHAAEALDRLARDAAGTPLILVIPEVDRQHWEVRQPVPWLPGHGVAEWYRALARGERALGDGDGRSALAAAHQMLTLDEGVVATTYRLLGRAWCLLDRLDRAEDACQAALEASPLATTGFLGSPRITPAEQELLRRAGAEHGWEVVDLPALFAHHQPTTPEAPRLFLDYCHLSAEGVDLAMSSVAARIMARWEAPQTSGTQRATALDVDPVVEARACIGAAVHAAHRALPLARTDAHREIAAWCQAAIAADPSALATLRTLAQLRLESVPPATVTSESRPQDHSLLDPRILALLEGAHSLTPQHGLLWEGLDGQLIEVVEHLLVTRGEPGLDYSPLWEPRPGNRVENRWWLESPLEQLYPDALDRDGQRRHAHFRAAWPRTTFWLGPSECDLLLRATVRTPGRYPATSPSIGVAVNGVEQDPIRSSPTWRERTTRLRATDFGPGLNRLTLTWPFPQAEESPIDELIQSLRQGEEVDLFPIFGELHALSVHRG